MVENEHWWRGVGGGRGGGGGLPQEIEIIFQWRDTGERATREREKERREAVG